MFKNFKFDGQKSTDYGIYISGEGVYDSPERDVEMIEVPGRNGALSLDNNRFKNIELTYPAGAFDSSQGDFSDKIKDLRNFLSSRKGYKRLEDEYHPDEYRMGVYKGGLEVKPVQYNTAGEFGIKFDCKPQRFLKSGETAQTFNADGTITNPTLFESNPLVAIWGEGEVGINGQTVEVLPSTPIGEIVLYNSHMEEVVNPAFSFSFATNRLETGDMIALLDCRLSISFDIEQGYTISNITEGMAQNSTATFTESNNRMLLKVYMYNLAFYKGTSNVISSQIAFSYDATTGGTTTTQQVVLTVNIRYTSPGSIQITLSRTVGNGLSVANTVITTGTVKGTSTMLIGGNPTYIDCDLGECYKIENNQMVSLNGYVNIGSDLPELSPGSNSITLGEDITKVEITPRWWII